MKSLCDIRYVIQMKDSLLVDPIGQTKMSGIKGWDIGISMLLDVCYKLLERLLPLGIHRKWLAAAAESSRSRLDGQLLVDVTAASLCIDRTRLVAIKSRRLDSTSRLAREASRCWLILRRFSTMRRLLDPPVKPNGIQELHTLGRQCLVAKGRSHTIDPSA